MDTPPHPKKYASSMYNHSNHSNHSTPPLPNTPEDDQIARDIREAIMDEYAISDSNRISESGRLFPHDRANNGPRSFHGDIKDLCDVDEDCTRMYLFMIAFFILLSIGCAGNFFIGVYATLNDWSRSAVALHLAVGNAVFVCGTMWLCRKLST